MKFIVRDDTPLKTVVSCIRLYHLIKACFRGEPETYSIKGIALYLGNTEGQILDEELSF